MLITKFSKCVFTDSSRTSQIRKINRGILKYGNILFMVKYPSRLYHRKMYKTVITVSLFQNNILGLYNVR